MPVWGTNQVPLRQDLLGAPGKRGKEAYFWGQGVEAATPSGKGPRSEVPVASLSWKAGMGTKQKLCQILLA